MAIKVKHFNGPRIYGHLVRPEQAVRAGVLILPTIFGVNEFAKGYAEVLAEAGLAAAVWDINSGQPLVTDYQECIRRARTLTDGAVAQMVGTWMEVMAAELGLESIGLLGFCIGGRFALLSAAADKRVRACAVAYPSIEDPRLANQERDALGLAPTIDCPVLVLQPGSDHVTKATTYERLNRSLFGRGAPTVLQYYPEAEHGFMHREQPDANRMATRMSSPQLIAFLTANLN
jgi:carboxymethylenebutenolidase